MTFGELIFGGMTVGEMPMSRRIDIWQNIRRNGIRRNDIRRNAVQRNGIRRIDIRRNGIRRIVRQWRIQVLLMGGQHNFFLETVPATQFRQLDNKPFVTCYLLPFSIFLFTRLSKIEEAAFKIQLGLLISI